MFIVTGEDGTCYEFTFDEEKPEGLDSVNVGDQGDCNLYRYRVRSRPVRRGSALCRSSRIKEHQGRVSDSKCQNGIEIYNKI